MAQFAGQRNEQRALFNFGEKFESRRNELISEKKCDNKN